ncbi:hypothetical protein LCGC14_2928920 [marine sediment metagenome]|uniref:Uncharacterized protein n=1 Tax=marine sediment metagenome TaxID=412755 RepID=A0A0F8XLY6_9ZZZZ
MAKNELKEGQNRLLCEKILNESWSKVEKYTEEIKAALEKGKLSEKDLVLIKLAARAFVQRAMMEKADSVALFGVDLYNTSPCGLNTKDDCPCDRKECLLVE